MLAPYRYHEPHGGDVLNDDDGGRVARWDGDLKHFSMTAWAEDGDLAAMVMVKPGGRASGWINLRLVHPDQCWPVWMRLRNTAARFGDGVLLAEDLAVLTPGGDDHSWPDFGC